MKRVLFTALLAATVAASSEAADYYPLAKGTIWVHESRSVYSGPKEAKDAERKVIARVVTEVEGTEIIDGKTYLRLLRRYEGMPGVSRIVVYRRIADDGVYIARKANDGLKEALELGLPPAIGRSWDYDDGVASKRSITDVTAVVTPAGKFERCLKVVRDFLTEARRRNYSQEAYFCEGIGPVKSLLMQQTAAGTVVTEETLVSTSLMQTGVSPTPEK